jgi:hypothetical protein
MASSPLPERGRIIDCATTPVYRGGSSMVARPGIDYKVNKKTGLILAKDFGLSLNTNKDKLIQLFGSASRVIKISDELMIVQQGVDLGHFILAPQEPMPSV